MKKIILLGMAASSLLSLVASAGQVASNYMSATRYDIQGRIVGTIAPDADGVAPYEYLATRNIYNSRGLLERVESGVLTAFPDETIPVANWGSYGFSGSNIRQVKGIDYDEYGRQTRLKLLDSAGNTTRLTQTSYDAGSRVNCTALRMNPAVYGSLPDACVQSTQGADGPDRISQFTYNEHEQVLTEERGVGTPLQQTYITNSYKLYTRLLESQTDAMGNATTLEYDDWGRLIKRNYPSATARGFANTSDYNEYRYDQNGNTRYERKRNGSVINYSYDNNNRLILKDYADNTRQQDIYYDYDNRGLQTAARFGSASGQGITNSFDGFGNVRVATNNVLGVSRSLTYVYDRDNNRGRITHPDGENFTYQFDQLDRFNSVADTAQASLLTVTYQANGRRNQLVRSGNAITNYTYNDQQQLSNFSQAFSNGANNFDSSFTYSAAGQILSLVQHNNVAWHQRCPGASLRSR